MTNMDRLHIGDLDLDLLIVFETMMEVRSVTAVSELLSMNQPNVSYALKRLRGFFGDELFIRTARGMQPTARALALQMPVQRMMEILRSEVLSPVEFRPQDSRRTFVINMTDIGELAFLPPLLKHFETCAPHVSVQPICLGAQNLLDAFRDGRVDLALGYVPELTARTVYVQSLLQHPFVCLARAGHPLATSGLTVSDFASAEHIGMMGEGHAQRQFEEKIDKLVGTRRIKFRTSNFMSVPFIVRDTDLIATVPKIMAIACADMPGLRVFKPPFDLDPIPISQYWTEQQHNDPGQIWLRRTIFEMARDSDVTESMQFW
jgi:DNA-binding transcriptional LysR family regulator